MGYSYGDIATIATKDELKELGYSCSADSALACYGGQQVRIVGSEFVAFGGEKRELYKIELVDKSFRKSEDPNFIFVGSVSDYSWPEYSLIEITQKDFEDKEFENILFGE